MRSKYAWHGWVTRDLDRGDGFGLVEFWEHEPKKELGEFFCEVEDSVNLIRDTSPIALHFLPTACLPAPGKCREVWVENDGTIWYREVE